MALTAGTAILIALALGGASASDASDPASDGKSPSSAPEARAAERESDLDVHLTPKMGRGPSLVRARVRVAPHPDNRRLRITIDSEGFYRSTFIQLDGAAAPRNHSVQWQSVPPGEYVLVATLYGPGGQRERTVRQVSFVLTGPSDDLSAPPPPRRRPRP